MMYQNFVDEDVVMDNDLGDFIAGPVRVAVYDDNTVEFQQNDVDPDLSSTWITRKQWDELKAIVDAQFAKLDQDKVVENEPEYI